jgi:LPXTG-motif cell wall-anchored protein
MVSKKVNPLLFSLIIILTFLYPLDKTFASSPIKEIDIAITPEKVLFNVNKLVPGDSASRTLNIKNSGKNDFKYIASCEYVSGSEILFDKLDLVIKDSNGVLFKGKLFEFNKLVPRLLKSKQNENLIFDINFPKYLGNEFQGLETQFQFNFYVEGTLGGLLPADGPKLPETGSNMYNILVLGAVLILFGLILQFAKRKRKQL